MDDFDIEIRPLGHASADERRVSPADITPPRAPQSPLAPRLSQRGRVLRVSGILGVLFLALTILVAVTPGARSAVVGFVQGPSPTYALPGDGHRFAVEHQLPWGTLTIDGYPAPSLAPIQTQTSTPQLTTFALARGHHQLEYRADPFPTLRCTLSVPEAMDDTCPLGPQLANDPIVPDGQHTRLLDLLGTDDRLSPPEQALLADATQSALDRAAAGANGALAPGDHYLDAAARVATAGEALTADAAYRFDRLPTLVDGEHCAILCTPTSPLAQSSADEWLLNGFASLSWRYRDAGDRVVLAEGPPGSPPGGRVDVAIQVGVRRVGDAWQVRLIPPTPAGSLVRDPLTCPVGAHFLDVLRENPDQATADSTDTSYRWDEWSSPAELGCVFGGGRSFDNQGNLTGSVAIVLYRYGALLAVNDEAHADFPHIPWASEHERALALAAWPPTADTMVPIN